MAVIFCSTRCSAKFGTDLLHVQGHGLAYGTKEGRLRLIHHVSTASAIDKASHSRNSHTNRHQLSQELAEADQIAAHDILEASD